MATIYPDSYSAQAQDPLFEALTKQNAEVTEGEISLDESTQSSGVTYGIQWPKDMNGHLIIPSCSRIQNFLEERGWIVKYRNFDALMLATFSMKLPKGTYAHPEKHMQDWEAAVGKINGAINLGLVSGEYTTSGSGDDGYVTYGAQWPEGMNEIFIIPNCSKIQYSLEGNGWNVTFKNFDALMIATFTLSLAKGDITHPEKHMKDWETALREVNGVINLGPVGGDVSTD